MFIKTKKGPWHIDRTLKTFFLSQGDHCLKKNIFKVLGVQRAFSLLEMTVVLIIMTIVASAIIPHMIQAFQVNVANKVAADIAAIQEASRAYYVANRSWPASMAVLQAGQYLPTSWNGINPFGAAAPNPSSYSYTLSSMSGTLTVTTTLPVNVQSIVENLLPVTSRSGTTFSSTVSVPGSASSLPSGSIIMWSGAIASIPSGWALCNGQNGTPNLMDRFVIAAGNNYGPGSMGGGSLNLSFSTVTVSTSGNCRGAVLCYQLLDSAALSFSLPPYYALFYIMKI